MASHARALFGAGLARWGLSGRAAPHRFAPSLSKHKRTGHRCPADAKPAPFKPSQPLLASAARLAHGGDEGGIIDIVDVAGDLAIDDGQHDHHRGDAVRHLAIAKIESPVQRALIDRGLVRNQAAVLDELHMTYICIAGAKTLHHRHTPFGQYPAKDPRCGRVLKSGFLGQQRFKRIPVIVDIGSEIGVSDGPGCDGGFGIGWRLGRAGGLLRLLREYWLGDGRKRDDGGGDKDAGKARCVDRFHECVSPSVFDGRRLVGSGYAGYLFSTRTCCGSTGGVGLSEVGAGVQLWSAETFSPMRRSSRPVSVRVVADGTGAGA